MSTVSPLSSRPRAVHATRPGEGNPAEVVLRRGWAAAGALRQRAAESRAPATAFLVEAGDAYEARWFTPTGELELCGHAALAAAHVVLTVLRPAARRIELRSPAVAVGATRRAGRVHLDLPPTPLVPVPTPSALAEALGRAPVTTLDAGAWVALLEDEDAVRRVAPDLARIAALDRRGVGVTAPGRTADFVTRYFAPRAGVGEDQATGSLHRALAPWWAARLGRSRLQARQLSPRGADVGCAWVGGRVRLSGHVRPSVPAPPVP